MKKYLEINKNLATRCLACNCLGLSIDAFQELESTNQSLVKHAFDTVMFTFLNVFPDSNCNIDSKIFEKSSNLTKLEFESRIQLISAISYFLDKKINQTDAFYSYIDTLFSSVLNSSAHPLMLAAVVKAVTKGFAKTNRNRLRVEKYYRKPIQLLIESFYQPKSNQKMCTIYLINILSKFSNKWDPLIADYDLLFRTSKNNETIVDEGYAQIRREYLQKFDKIECSLDDLDKTQKLKIIYKADLSPYQKLEKVSIQVKFFQRQINNRILILISLLPTIRPINRCIETGNYCL